MTMLKLAIHLKLKDDNWWQGVVRIFIVLHHSRLLVFTPFN